MNTQAKKEEMEKKTCVSLVKPLRKTLRRKKGLMKKVIYIVCLTALMGAIIPMQASATTEVFHSSRDNYIRQDIPDRIFDETANVAMLYVRSYNNSRNMRSLIHFDLSSIPSGATIDSATLKIQLWNWIQGNRTHNVHRITSDWTAKATWNNRSTGTPWTTPGGDYDSTATASNSTGTTYDVWVEWDVKTDVQAFVDGSFPNYGWLIKDAVEDSEVSQGVKYKSDEYTIDPTMRPYLEVTYTEAAEPPHLATYTISNRTITPPQTTEIDVEFSERVSYKIAIEKDTAAIYDWTGTAKNPDPEVWNGTYEVNGTVVPDGDYYVNVTGTNTTTGLSVVNNTEVITVMSITEQPDLLVTSVNAYHYEGAKTGYAWFNLTNYVDVTVKNNGTADADAFNVSLYADEEFIGEQRISNLSSGSNETLVFEWTPIGIDEQDGGSPRTYSMLAKADPYNEIGESNETNNNLTASETVKYNGYMADEPLNTFSHGTLRGGLLFTTGDGSYSGAKGPGLVETVHYNVDIPPTSSVVLAKLNVYYTWYKPYGGPTYPQMRVEVTNQTGTYNVTLETAYNDRACSFSGWNLPWGNYVYDLSDYIKQNGSYTVSVYNNGTGYQSFAIAAPGLVVLYKDDSMPLIEYWLAEGADVLMGGRRSDSGNYLTLEECINNATFEGSINLSKVKNATLGVVSPWGSWGWFPGSGNVLYFNDVEIGRSPDVYLNGGNAIGDISLDGIRMTGTGAAQVGVNLSNVTGYLNADVNIAGQGDEATT